MVLVLVSGKLYRQNTLECSPPDKLFSPCYIFFYSTGALLSIKHFCLTLLVQAQKIEEDDMFVRPDYLRMQLWLQTSVRFVLKITY